MGTHPSNAINQSATVPIDSVTLYKVNQCLVN
jgi:hypothetical protein